MNALTTARQVVRKMSSEEIKIFRRYQNAFNTRGENEPSKAGVLLSILLEEIKKGIEYSETEIERLLYGKIRTVAFPRMLLRFREKLFESLQLSPNIERDGMYSERAKVMYEIRREISVAQILNDKGLSALAFEIFDDLIVKSLKYELYEEAIRALRSRIELVGYSGNGKSLNQDKVLYEKALKCISAVSKAMTYYSTLLSETEHNAIPGEPYYSEILENQVNDLYSELKITSSAHVAFYLNYIEAHHLQLQCRYKAAGKVLKEQVISICEHPAIKSPARLAGAILNYAWNEIYSHQFSNSLIEIEKAEKLLPSGHVNLFQCKEARFYNYFYTGQYKAALEVVEKLIHEDVSLGAEFRAGKRNYFRAAIAFIEKDHQLVLEILRELNPIEVDDEGWNIGIRLLHIMNDIELDKIDNASARLENLRKHLEKVKKKSNLARRYLMQYEILRDLIQNQITFTEIYTRRKSEIDELNSSDSILKWRVLSPELIPFNQWFESHLFKKELTIKMIPYHEPISVIR